MCYIGWKITTFKVFWWQKPAKFWLSGMFHLNRNIYNPGTALLPYEYKFIWVFFLHFYMTGFRKPTENHWQWNKTWPVGTFCQQPKFVCLFVWKSNFSGSRLVTLNVTSFISHCVIFCVLYTFFKMGFLNTRRRSCALKNMNSDDWPVPTYGLKKA